MRRIALYLSAASSMASAFGLGNAWAMGDHPHAIIFGVSLMITLGLAIIALFWDKD